ncbi:hypothetical protein [Paenibacillus ihuae]|uniref:hypothetical protein n=1 Tax=Paenibacillus ihuae TaxID=1232431 RepID=UPI0006D56DB3|nr:hypothetical protein [Paenibacillus ihuae]
MRALMWKKYNEFQRSKIRMLVFFILPAAYLFLLLMLNIKTENIIAFYSLSVILLQTFVFFSIEELVSTEVILATNTSIKKIWLVNLLYTAVIGFIYSNIILWLAVLSGPFLFGIDFNITTKAMLHNVLNIVIGASIIGFSTIHYSDYSKFKQVLASVAGLLIYANPFLFLFYYGKEIHVSLQLTGLSFVLALFVLWFSYWIVNNPNKENLIINTQKLLKTFEESNTIEE